MKIAQDISYNTLYRLVQSIIETKKANDMVVSLTPVAIYQAEDDKEKKTITLRLKVTDHTKTLTDQDVSELVDAIANKATDELDAEKI